jgi:hypothetical protein
MGTSINVGKKLRSLFDGVSGIIGRAKAHSLIGIGKIGAILTMNEAVIVFVGIFIHIVEHFFFLLKAFLYMVLQQKKSILSMEMKNFYPKYPFSKKKRSGFHRFFSS